MAYDINAIYDIIIHLGEETLHTLEVDIQYTDGTRIERQRLDNAAADNLFIPAYGALHFIRV